MEHKLPYSSMEVATDENGEFLTVPGNPAMNTTPHNSDEITHAINTGYVDMEGKEIKEITIIDQVKDIEARSGVAFEIDITEVVSLAKRAAAITDVNDPNFALVKKECQQKRKYVTEWFKDARDGFNKLAKGVIEVEKTVLAEFTPEEDRLIAMDKAEKERLLIEARLEALPAKRERIVAAGIEIIDEVVLTLTDADFELLFATKLAEKAETDRLAAEAKLAEERAAFEAEKAELARKQAEADAIEQARKEEREAAAEELRLAQEKAERDIKEAEERRKAELEESRLRLEAEERARKEQIEREEQQRIEKIKADTRLAEEAEAKRQADEKWQAFLKAIDYNEETDLSQMTNTGVRIYRFVAEYKN